MSKHSFSDAEKKAVYRAIAERRDMRHFNDKPVNEGIFRKILAAAHMAPSVGLMQPWRFLRIEDRSLRQNLFDLVDEERINTADALGDRKSEFLKLKVEGILQCAEIIVAALPDGREKHVFGRRTLPEMDLASLSCAIQNMWLAARVEGIGMGWVSIFDPIKLSELLKMPEGSKPVAILCIGHVEAFYQRPMLVEEDWTEESPLDELLFSNQWGQAVNWSN